MQGDTAGLPGALQRPATTGYMPTPPPKQPQNSSADQVPQYVTPQLQQPQYQGPKKGLEYLALGLGLLFPGAPIGRLAAGFAGGLNQGAQQKYQRQEQQATEQNQQARDTAQANFENAKMQYEAAQQLRNQGIDPKTQKPFVLPPDLQRILPPGSNRQPTAQDYMLHEQKLAQFYSGLGASGPAQQHAAAAEDYNRQIVDDNNNARALAVAELNYQRDLQVAGIHEEGMERRIGERISGALSGLRAEGIATPIERQHLREQAATDSAKWMHAYTAAITPPTKNGAPVWVEARDAQGNVIYQTKPGTQPGDDDYYVKDPATGKPMPVMRQAAPAINAGLKAQMAKIITNIDRSPDPIGAAQYYASSIDNPAAVQLLLDRGNMDDVNRRAQGGGTVTKPFQAPEVSPPKTNTKTATAQAKHAGSEWKGFGSGGERKPKFPNPPDMPTGATYIGAGPSGGDLYQMPNGSQHEYTGP
jgi:hypothetical protein